MPSKHSSRYVTPVSEFGSLAIGGQNTHGRDKATTRSSAARRAASHRTTGPQTPATPPSSATRRRPHGHHFSRNDDMSGDDDDDEQEEDSDAEAAGPDPSMVIRRTLTLLSLYAPEGMLPHEILSTHDGPLNAECTMFRNAMTYMASHVTTATGMQHLSRCFRSGDETWSSAMVNRLVRSLGACLRNYQDTDNVAFDALAALDEFKRIYEACCLLFIQQLLGERSTDVAELMVRILEIIILHGDHDRPSPYNTGQNEYNLYRRFVMDDDHFDWACERLLLLVGRYGHASAFKDCAARFATMSETVRAKHEDEEADSPSYRLQERLRQICALLAVA